MPLEPLTGIEPAHPAWKAGVLPLNYGGIGAGRDGLHARLLSFQLSVWGEEKEEPMGWIRPIGGAAGGTRTHDLLITNQLLCQLSYNGVCAVRAGCPRTAIGRRVFPLSRVAEGLLQ